MTTPLERLKSASGFAPPPLLKTDITAAVEAIEAARRMHDNASGHYMVAEDMFAFEMAIDRLTTPGE